jgi:hypothetical protein
MPALARTAAECAASGPTTAGQPPSYRRVARFGIDTIDIVEGETGRISRGYLLGSGQNATSYILSVAKTRTGVPGRLPKSKHEHTKVLARDNERDSERLCDGFD